MQNDSDDDLEEEYILEKNVEQDNESEYSDQDQDNCLYEEEEEGDIDDDEKIIILTGDDRITAPNLTKYEKVRIIGVRAKQIAMGGKKFIKNVDHKTPKEIALLELEYKLIPFKIRRPLPQNRVEIWKLSELN